MPRYTCITSCYGLTCILLNTLLSSGAVYALSKLFDISGDVSRIARFVQWWILLTTLQYIVHRTQGDKVLSRMSC